MVILLNQNKKEELTKEYMDLERERIEEIEKLKEIKKEINNLNQTTGM